MSPAPTKDRPLVEVCIGSVADALAAQAAGADRVELCAATEVGGLTPSLGLLEQVLAASRLPVIAMIRPRPGGFAYSREEFAVALRDAEHMLAFGAAGLAFGFLTPEGRLDAARTRELVDLAGDRETVFHRAFDFTPDLLAAADELVELGVQRVLTSGGAATAFVGANTIRAIHERVAGRLEVMPGGGIAAESVVELIQQTGCDQLHVGASLPDNDGSLTGTGSHAGNNAIEFFDPRYLERGNHRAVAPAKLDDLIAELKKK
jgi:copper homeostasis protein